MKNEQIIMNTRINLMRNGQLGTTGRKIEYVDRDGFVSEIDEPAEIHTYTGWKQRGFQVPKGTKARVFIPIWNYIEVYGFNEKINKILLNDKDSLNIQIVNSSGIRIELFEKNIKAFIPINIILK